MAKGPSKATLLVDYARRAGGNLFHTRDQSVYAQIPAATHREVWQLKSRSFRLWLRQIYFERTGEVVSGSVLRDALELLSAHALFKGEEREVHVRLAESGGDVYLDLCNDRWEQVRIGPDGWELLTYSPVLFRRARGMFPLPVPERGGSVESLRSILNLVDESSWVLAIAWLLAALRPRGPYPVLALHGEQGAGKSWTARVLRSLVDPNVAALRSSPRDVRDLMIAANNGWAIAFDNLSHLEPWLSDALCRLATGGGLATRELFTDTEETLLDATRPVCLTSIEELAVRGDLLDRCVLVELTQIPDERRMEERVLEAQMDQLRPEMLGALCDVIVAGLGNVEHVKLKRLPRMADFATWAVACEPALGWKPGTFLDAYQLNRGQANDLALEASPVAAVLRKWWAGREGDWTGTASELLACLNLCADPEQTRQRSWPKAPNKLSGALKRVAPNLRTAGLVVDFERKRVIRISNVGFQSSRSSGPAPEGGDSNAPDCSPAANRSTGIPQYGREQDDRADTDDKKRVLVRGEGEEDVDVDVDD